MIRFDVADRMMLYSLDCLVLCYQEQRTRGFAAYEAMRGVTFSSRKKFIVGFATYEGLPAEGWRQAVVLGFY